MKKNILLTFDYELFLGQRSGTVDNCLIIPSYRILEILNSNNAKAIFFIDTTYLFRLEELSHTNKRAYSDFEKIKKQLNDIAVGGHYLFHHIHPHWLDAQYLEDINQWNLSNTDRFAFTILDDAEKDLLFTYSDGFLSEIYKQAGSTNNCNGFRAGGLFIVPFTCFKPYFEKFNIGNDFSVSPGDKIIGDKWGYDFSNCPSNRVYSFYDQVSLENKDKKFCEFPISKIKIKGITKFLNSVYYRVGLKMPQNIIHGDGQSVADVTGITLPPRPLKNYFSVDLNISVEMLNMALIRSYKKVIKQRHYIHFLSHPKLVSEFSLRSFNRLLKFCNKNFDCEYDFARFDKL